MIYLYLLLDILVYNFTIYNSYFFLVGLINKKYIYYLSTGLIIDFILLNTFFINTIVLTFIYIVNKFFKRFNIKSFTIYIINLMVDYILYITLTFLITNNNFNIILITIGLNLFVNTIFYILSYKYKIYEYN